MKRFFAKNATGLNADIDRHRSEEARLNTIIADLEDKEDDMSVACKKTFIELRDALRQNKAELVNKLGKIG
jgi:phage-related minor tail protein